MKIDRNAVQKEFNDRFQKMLDLVSRGRGIEILIRMSQQTQDGLKQVSHSYDQMMESNLLIPHLHPPQALPSLFSDVTETERILLARDIADKLAHGLYRAARKLVDRYVDLYGLDTKLLSEGKVGWTANFEGHVFETDGRKIHTVVDHLKSTNKNLIVEEFDVFCSDNYYDACIEIFDFTWKIIATGEVNLAMQSLVLHMHRGFKRGVRTYVEDD